MKNKIVKILLVLLPFMAVVLATTPDSVKLIEVATGETVTGSYFQMLNDSVAAVCPFYAAVGGIFSLLFSVIFAFSHKKGLLQASRWCAFAGACLAVLPVVQRGEVLILPHVLMPILLFADFVLATFAKKWDLSRKEAVAAPRLDRH